MASSWSSIISTLKTTLEAVTGIEYVSTYPITSDAWVEQFVSQNGNIPAVHISLESSGAERYTTNDHIETMDVILTVLERGKNLAVTDLITHRDALIAGMESDQSVSGNADSVTYTGWEISEQAEYTTVYKLTFAVEHIWS